MPEYEFMSKAGRVVSRVYRMSDVPATIRVAGVQYRRQVGIGLRPIVRGQPHLARSQARQWTPGLAQHYDKWNPLGIAAIDGQADQRRFRDALRKCKATARQNIEYDTP